MAVIAWAPSAAAALFHDIEQGAVRSSLPAFAPSTRNCTPATPVSSAAVAVRLTAPMTVAPPAGAVNETVGGVTSEGGAVFTLTVVRASAARVARCAITLAVYRPG